MKKIVSSSVGVALLVGVAAAAHMSPAWGEAAPVGEAYVTRIPAGYRDWRLVSVAREEANLDDIRAILGNDVAIQAYRQGKLPFPKGAMIVRLAYAYEASEENNQVFGRRQSFVAGHPKNGVQFMVKDAKKVRGHGGLGIRPIRRRKTDGRVDAQDLLSLPRSGAFPRLRVHSVLPLVHRPELRSGLMYVRNRKVPRPDWCVLRVRREAKRWAQPGDGLGGGRRRWRWTSAFVATGPLAAKCSANAFCLRVSWASSTSYTSGTERYRGQTDANAERTCGPKY